MSNQQKPNKKPETFFKNYRIGTTIVPSAQLDLNLQFIPETQSVFGSGTLKSTALPVVNERVIVRGKFEILQINDVPGMVVTLTGHSDLIILPDPTKILELTMVLNNDLSKGTANFRYLVDNKWWYAYNNTVQQLAIRFEPPTAQALAANEAVLA